MAKSNFPEFQLPGDDDRSFEQTKDILTFKPTIEYEEPAQEEGLNEAPPPPTPVAVEEIRQRVQSAIEAYKAIGQLASDVQDRLDKRIENGGGMEVKLDPQKDAHVIAAIQRCYPECKDPTKINYEMYKICLARMASQSANVPQITPEDIAAAKTDPYRTDFGGMTNTGGENRPEISSPANVVKPVDLKAFQAAAVVALFALLLPMINQNTQAAIAQHLVTAKHA